MPTMRTMPSISFTNGLVNFWPWTGMKRPLSLRLFKLRSKTMKRISGKRKAKNAKTLYCRMNAFGSGVFLLRLDGAGLNSRNPFQGKIIKNIVLKKTVHSGQLFLWLFFEESR